MLPSLLLQYCYYTLHQQHYLPLREGHDVAEGVRDHLDLDVVRVLDEPLDQHAVVTEGAASLRLTEVITLSGLVGTIFSPMFELGFSFIHTKNIG